MFHQTYKFIVDTTTNIRSSIDDLDMVFEIVNSKTFISGNVQLCQETRLITGIEYYSSVYKDIQQVNDIFKFKQLICSLFIDNVQFETIYVQYDFEIIVCLMKACLHRIYYLCNKYYPRHTLCTIIKEILSGQF